MKKGILVAVSSLVGCVIGYLGQNYLNNKKVKEKERQIKKYKDYYHLLNQWFILIQEKKSLDSYFLKNNISTISIYGMGELGNRLLESLKETSIEIKYAIDKNSNSTFEVNVVSVDDELEEVDAIIVTAIFDFDQIEQTLSEKCSCPIISLEEVIFDI